MARVAEIVAARVPVGRHVSLEDDPTGSTNDGVGCPCSGCDFRVEADLPHWVERMEQHVRWIHIKGRDFGTAPVASLFALLANGVIRPEEFALFVRDVIQVEMDALDKPVPPRRLARARLYLTVAAVGTFVALFANAAVILTGFVPLTLFSTSGIFATFGMVVAMSFLLSRPEPVDVRFRAYPDTDNSVVDDEGGDE